MPRDRRIGGLPALARRRAVCRHAPTAAHVDTQGGTTQVNAMRKAVIASTSSASRRPPWLITVSTVPTASATRRLPHGVPRLRARAAGASGGQRQGFQLAVPHDARLLADQHAAADYGEIGNALHAVRRATRGTTPDHGVSCACAGQSTTTAPRSSPSAKPVAASAGYNSRSAARTGSAIASPWHATQGGCITIAFR